MSTSKREAMDKTRKCPPQVLRHRYPSNQRLCQGSVSHTVLPCVVLLVHSYLSSLANKGSITEPTCGIHHSFLEIWFFIVISGQGTEEQKINHIILSKESLRQTTRHHPTPCSTLASRSEYPRQEVGSSVAVKWSFLAFLCPKLATTAVPSE